MSTWFVDGIRMIKNDDIIIGFIGPVGAGKSHLIDLLTGQPNCRTGHTLDATTTQVNAVRVKHPKYGDRVVLVDTPGFNDTVRSSTQVLRMINRWLQKTYKKGVKLHGVVYLHRITDNRLIEPLKSLCMFRELCGDSILTQVALVSTMWGELAIDDGMSREKELVEFYWKPLIERGSKLDRLSRNDSEDAWRIIGQLIRRNDLRAIARLQEELLILGSRLQNTHAGRILQNSLQKALVEQKSSLKHVISQNQRPIDRGLSASLTKKYVGCENQTRKAFEEIRRSKFDLGAEISVIFCSKSNRATSIKAESIADCNID